VVQEGEDVTAGLCSPLVLSQEIQKQGLLRGRKARQYTHPRKLLWVVLVVMLSKERESTALRPARSATRRGANEPALPAEATSPPSATAVPSTLRFGDCAF